MAGFATHGDFLTALTSGQVYDISFEKHGRARSPGNYVLMSGLDGRPGKANRNTTAIACTNAVANGSHWFPNHATESKFIVRTESDSTYPFLLIDVLATKGGINGAAGGAVAINTPALTRYSGTGAVGNMAGIMFKADMSTGTSFSVTLSKYTNQAGTANKVGGTVSTGSVYLFLAGAFLLFSLADGDSGIRSVEEITINSAATGATLDLVLFRPLLGIPPGVTDFFSNKMPPRRILDGACLDILCTDFNNNSAQSSVLAHRTHLRMVYK